MLKNLCLLFLIMALSGCGGESGKDKDTGKEQGEKKQTTNTPGNEGPANKKDRSGGKKGGSASSSKVRTDGMFSAGKHMQDMNKLKQIAIAMHNHHDVYRHFPTVPYKAGAKNAMRT